ncbi:MAG: hypothetical protein JST02_01440 [Bacteroidetes bacterium]|nr:hypothetical protein [Bacteroidota bacterium]
MKHFFIAAILLSSSVAFSQSKKFNFKLGSEYELPRRSEDLAFFGNDKDGIVNLSLKKDELNIVRFNPKTLGQTDEKTIVLPDATRNLNSEIVVDFGTDYFWIHSDWDKKEETENLYYDKIDVVSGKITVANQKMLQSTKIAGVMAATGFYSYKTVGKYKFDFNADTTMMLVSYRLVPEEKNDRKNYDRIGIHVYDRTMKKLWGGEFTMPYTEAVMDNSDFSIDYQGNAYLLAKVYDSEKRKERDKETGKPAYHYEVLKFTKDSKKIIQANINLDDYFIRESSLIENTKHEMIIACTYSKKSKSNGTDGVFLAMLDQEGKVTKYMDGYYEFPLEELQKFETARKRRKMEKKDDYEAPNIRVRNVAVEADGSVFIACEEYHMEVVTNYNGRYTTTTYYYYYDDIIGSKIDSKGKFLWVRKIPKRQMGTNRYATLGFKLVTDPSGYYFLYLDNKKNIDLPDDEAPKRHEDGFGGQVVVSKIDNTGNVSKEIVFDTREEDIMIFPRDFDKINKNQFIGRAKVKRGNYMPVLITVNE